MTLEFSSGPVAPHDRIPDGVPAMPTGLTGRCPVIAIIGLTSFVVWLVVVAQDARGSLDAPLARWLTLRTDGFEPRALLLHAFYYQNGLHFLVTMLVLCGAGARLEMRWGATRLVGFLAVATVVSAVGALALAPLFQTADAPRPLCTFGAGAAALAALTLWLLFELDRIASADVLWVHAFWAAVMLAATGLLALELPPEEDRLPCRIFLLPQLSGVFLAWGCWVLRPAFQRLEFRREIRRRCLQEQRARSDRERVNRLLDKILREGLASLSREERAFLDRASRHYGSRRV